ncbi:MAG: CPBP family intramembrane metalloprotease [Candidatus Moranbacteria bacterium]|nr:CPBP family intramembrane metalloprotease [Candidatus Moranbacteria bacterium]
MKTEQKVFGWISLLGTYCMLVLIAHGTGWIGIVARELGLFVSGRYGEISVGHEVFLAMLPVILTVVVFEFPSVYASGVAQHLILGKNGKHAVSDMFSGMGQRNHFFRFFIVTSVEEIFARWLFLGVLTKIPFLSGPIAFYLLFFIGNAIWSLMHLSNFIENKDRKMLRVLPQFVAGIFFSYVFLKYGLFATILTHFASNMILFSLHKIERIGVNNGLFLAYEALCAIVSYMLIGKPFTDIAPWFSESPVFRLEGWVFWDYVKISVFLSSCAAMVACLLLYDNGKSNERDADTGVAAYIFGPPIIIGLICLLYALLGLIVPDVSTRIFVSAIVFLFILPGASGSSVARTFWISLPNMYISICIVQALGFWAALVWLAVEMIVSSPSTIVNRIALKTE